MPRPVGCWVPEYRPGMPGHYGQHGGAGCGLVCPVAAMAVMLGGVLVSHRRGVACRAHLQWLLSSLLFDADV
ncbi:hypothetical protein ACQKDS_01345 [Serratia sp. NPDC078593]|uniref:hypothetical protein n=1 Tax=unclassified Serratia (in: enterobacteria) TaxID=2647522 RepID=UPI0037D7A2C7